MVHASVSRSAPPTAPIPPPPSSRITKNKTKKKKKLKTSELVRVGGGMEAGGGGGGAKKRHFACVVLDRCHNQLDHGNWYVLVRPRPSRAPPQASRRRDEKVRMTRLQPWMPTKTREGPIYVSTRNRNGDCLGNRNVSCKSVTFFHSSCAHPSVYYEAS